ncbi:MAG: hypothetical protein SPE99_07240 [Blautia sp.]|nr:hypothetical protein [Blautia sp.]
MKKKYILFAVLLVLTAVAAGCGKKKTQDQDSADVQEIVTPAADAGSSEDIVQMQTAADKEKEEAIQNVIGEKTSTSSSVVLVNKTGDDVAAIYIRPNTDDDDEWGDELIQKKFTFKNGEKAEYYYEKNQKDDQGNTADSFDIRISYTDENKNECFFRKLPLTKITQITLRMDGTGEDSIPYATYLTGSSKVEQSTLEEVRQRLGLSSSGDDEDDDLQEAAEPDEDDEDDMRPTSAPSSSDTAQPTSAPSSSQSGDSSNGTLYDDLQQQPDDPGSVAEEYIGQSFDNLVNACGEPTGSDWVDEPESGETGYHYYDSFTVSTVIDENGNEIVAGVW